MGVFLVFAVFVVPAIAIATAAPSDGAVEFTSYEDQLNINERAAYDAINLARPDVRTITVVLPLALTVTSDNLVAAHDYMLNEIRTLHNNVFRALRLSSPLAYWGWDANSINRDIPDGLPVSDLTQNGNQYTVTTLTWKIDPAPPPGTQSKENTDVEKMIDDLKAAVDKFHTDSTTTRDKIWDINNYLVNLITYDPYGGVNVPGADGKTEGVFSHDAYGALVSPNVAVCDGYSEAFLLLCQKENIECVIVYGSTVSAVSGYTNHAWNYVKLDNDKWYAIDVTWNDNGKGDNPYFLKGGDTFFTTHNQGVFLGDGLKPYQFNSPVISTDDYDKASVEPNYDLFGWIAAAVIVIIIAVSLYVYSKENK